MDAALFDALVRARPMHPQLLLGDADLDATADLGASLLRSLASPRHGK